MLDGKPPELRGKLSELGGKLPELGCKLPELVGNLPELGVGSPELAGSGRGARYVLGPAALKGRQKTEDDPGEVGLGPLFVEVGGGMRDLLSVAGAEAIAAVLEQAPTRQRERLIARLSEARAPARPVNQSVRR